MHTSSSSQLVYKSNIDSTKKVQDSERLIIPYFSLYSDRLVIHPRPFINIIKRPIHQNSLNNLKRKKFTGNISKTQKSIIKKKLTAWLSSIEEYNIRNRKGFNRSEYYPVFVTLTLCSKQKETDQEIKRKMLDLFIKNIKNNYNVNKYFWRAETQKNGNIHFHLIIDKYIKYEELKQLWNRILDKNGYIKEFKEKYNHENPNSVDIRSAAQVDNFVNYVLKYCLKDEKYRKINGRVYGMSDELRNIQIYQSELDSYLSDNLLRYIKKNYFKIYNQEYSTVILFNKEFYNTSFYQELKDQSSKYYLRVYDKLYNPEVSNEKIINVKKHQLIKNESQLKLFKLSDQVRIHRNYYSLKSISEEKNYIINGVSKYVL